MFWTVEDRSQINFFDGYINTQITKAQKMRLLLAQLQSIDTKKYALLVEDYMTLVKRIEELKIWETLFASQCILKYRKEKGVVL